MDILSFLKNREPEPEKPASRPLDDTPLKAAIVAAMRTVHDPEIPVNIYDLGLIYGLSVDETSKVFIEMTLTAPACPVAGTLPKQVAQAVSRVPGVKGVRVTLVWDPPWSKARMSDEARMQLGMF